MPNQLFPTLLLLLVTLTTPGAGVASPVHADPADFLPSGASIRQTVVGDVDGNGREDLVALYSIQATASAQPRAGLLILLATDDGVRPAHPFGEPPGGLRGEPVLDPNGSTDLTLTDVNADGIPEIMLSVTVRYQEPRPRTMLWVFGRGDVAVQPNDPDGPSAPTWAGTGFRLEAYLEGNVVTVMAPVPGSPDGTSALRREIVDRQFSGPDPSVELSETYVWQAGGYRLAVRSLSVPAETGNAARSPETAVLGFYNAQARGDTQAAVNLLGDELRTGRSATLSSDPSAPPRQIYVEEVRTIDEYLPNRARSETDRIVYVRVSTFDPRSELPPGASAESIAAAPTPTPPRYTVAGTWRTQKVGEQWRLAAAALHETANLDAISRVLPPGVAVVQTAGADLRGQGVEDLAVVVAGPGRFGWLEPYVVLGGPSGPERSVPLGSFVEGGFFGAVGATIRANDVNADGKPEIAFSAFVGAHSALLWVLQWNGSTFVPLFAEVSNSPTVDLADLDDDGVAEIVLGQSGYCGSYAASPQMTFAFRWENGAYRPASMRYPSLYEALDERAEDVREGHLGDGRDDARACMQHMLAMAHAFRGRAAETRTAYRAYARYREAAQSSQTLFLRPVYLTADYVEADLRAVLAAAESGQSPGWGASERAILHDLLGDLLLDRARGYRFFADNAAEHGRADESREARRKASEARQAATREYQAALALDPEDEEARRAIGE